MRRSTVRSVTVVLAVLACGLWGARAEPPAVDRSTTSSPDPIREFREGWELFDDNVSLNDVAYAGLIERMEWLVTELGRSGGAGHDVLIEHLVIPTQPLRGQLPYTRVKVAIADTAAEFELRQAIPALTEVIDAGEPERNTSEFEAFRILSVAAADALVVLDGREAVPALRAAFDEAFEGTGGAWAEARLRHFPAALVALGDNSWLEDRLIELLDSADRNSRGKAAFVAQQTRGEKIVPHLIDYLRETGDLKAEWALRKISGQSYPGLESWEAWWELNAARSRGEWRGLPPNSSWKGVWERDLFGSIQTQFLCNQFLCWRKAGYADSPPAAALELARRVRALEIEASVVERLRSQLGNHSDASCCRIWGRLDRQGNRIAVGTSRGGSPTGAVSQTIAPEPDPYCGCDRPPFSTVDGSVAENAEILLNAIACVDDETLCGDWIKFGVAVQRPTTVATTATTVTPAASAPGGTSAGTAARPESPAQDGEVSFEILPAVRDTQSSEGYVVGEPISIRCVWRNAREWPVSVNLKDHDEHRGTLDYPVSLSARVIDSAGTVLTENTLADHGWWSEYLLWSTTFEEMPGDVVTLQPGEEVVRIVPLDQVLRGLDGFPDGLSEGTYLVRLSLGMGSMVSNQLEIEILGE